MLDLIGLGVLGVEVDWGEEEVHHVGEDFGREFGQGRVL